MIDTIFNASVAKAIIFSRVNNFLVVLYIYHSRRANAAMLALVKSLLSDSEEDQPKYLPSFLFCLLLSPSSEKREIRIEMQCIIAMKNKIIMMCANNLWRLLFLATVVAVTTTMTGVVTVASKDGECSANDASCVAANDAEPAVEEALTECKDAEKECAYWASLGEVSVDWFIKRAREECRSVSIVSSLRSIYSQSMLFAPV